MRIGIKKSGLLREMENYFGKDVRRIEHAQRVAEYAEKIMEGEESNYDVVMAAAVLHDIGIHEAEKKYGSTCGSYQEKEGPPIARKILEGLKVPGDIIEEVCLIIGSHHSPGEVSTLNFKVLYDADWLVNLADEFNFQDGKKLSRIIEKVFLTETGKNMARTIYLKGGELKS